MSTTNSFGIPTGRTAGTFQNHTCSFDAATGNLTFRKDNTRNRQEDFEYDNLNRLTVFAGKSADYDIKGNITQKSDVGTDFLYRTPGKPYAISGISLVTTPAVPMRSQSVTCTSFERPSCIAENGYTAAFTYNAAGDRVKMHLTDGGSNVLTRYYLGGVYEIDNTPSGTKERLYLGGDAYSAPAVYVKEGAGNWNIYYICRDYLGSITHITNSSGSVVQELSYNAGGRLRNPANQTAYTPGSEPTLLPSLGVASTLRRVRIKPPGLHKNRRSLFVLQDFICISASLFSMQAWTLAFSPA
jgi:YD repeat-containing protein